MTVVHICVGSSCYLNGATAVVELFEKAIEEHGLNDEIMLAGSLCLGKCNRKGVTVQVNDEIFVGVTKESFKEFFEKHILNIAQ